MALAPEQTGIGIRRYFTDERTHPYDQVGWERRDARITNYRDGTVAFEQLGVEFPVDLVAQRHQHRRPEVLPGHARHARARDVAASRSSTGWSTRSRTWGIKGGYFVDDREADAFRDELKYLMVTQRAAFNSPVWFNIGVPGVPQQASACFILSVDDQMDSILNWYVEEGTIFKGGSGSGINLSRIRSSRRAAQGRRHRVGSGQLHARRRRLGRHDQVGWQDPARRQDGHPQRRPPRHRGVHLVQGQRGAQGPRARATPASTWTSTARTSHSIQYQNANNSVRVTDEFMQAVVDDADWHLRAVTTGEVVRTVRARDLFRQIAQAAWECADPGMQFDTTINRWHTAANTGRINGSNPCSEYMHLDNSACNLASINLLKFLATTTTTPSTSRASGRPSRWCSPPRRSWSAAPTTRPSRSARPPAGSASSASATPTSAPCSWRSACPTTPTAAGPGPPPSPR